MNISEYNATHPVLMRTSVALLLLVSSAFVAAGAPPQPSNLSYLVYSRTSAELFWDRPATVGLRYEIKQNGNVLKTIEGVSHYENQLTAGTNYEYQVMAINSQGERSVPASVSFKTKGVTTQETSVATPTGLRASVYSRSSAEIFWDRPATFGLTYEIIRSEQVVKITDGVSYYDNDLRAGTSYTYQVVAIDATGQRSQPAIVVLNTLGVKTGGGNESEPITFSLDQSPAAAISEPADYYQRNGYGNLDVIRIDVKTVTTPGTCEVGDLSGCTLADLLADIDKRDELKVEIAVHFKSDDFSDDGSVSNATMRMRGSGSRLGDQKSFRIKLDSKQDLWRNERHIQLNKSPFDSSRIRNKLAFDTMSDIPHMPSIRTQFVNLWIDDGDGPVDQGLYHHVERPSKYYLQNRGFDPDGNMYDAEDFQFELSDLSDVAVDADGVPINEDFFESALGINAGEDHRQLVAMLTALHDPERTFVSVLDQYFDRNNVMTWMAVNILLHQYDAVRHNYYLFNPAGSEKFYFLPWDYDEALGTWKEPPDNYERDSLRQRVDFGYAAGEPNIFISNFYRLPGMHQQMILAVDYIRQNYMTDAIFTQRAEKYIRIAEPFQQRAPDDQFNPWFNISSAMKFARGPGENVDALKSRFSIPMPPTLYEPVLQGSEWRFSWKPAYDVTGNGIKYELQVSRNPSFEPEDVVVDLINIGDADGTVIQGVDESQLPSGTYYARLTARANNDPDRFWQISLNRLEQDGRRYYGVMRFTVP